MKTLSKLMIFFLLLYAVENQALSVVAVATPDTICPGGSFNLQATAYGASGGNINIMWTSIPAGYSSVSASNIVTTNITRTYVVLVVNAGIAATDSVTVIVKKIVGIPGPIIGPNNVCETDTITYQVSPSPDISQYNWEVPIGWNIISGQGKDSIVVRASSSSGKVKVTPYNDCGAGQSKGLNVLVNPIPGWLDPISGNSYPCEGTEQIYSVNQVPYATWYQWIIPPSWTVVSGLGTSIITVIVQDKGELSVTPYNECGAGILSTMRLVEVDPLPGFPGPIIGPSDVYENDTIVYEVEPIINTNEYVWDIPPSWTMISGWGTPILTVIVRESGQIKLTPLNECGPGKITRRKDVLVSPMLDVPKTDGDIKIIMSESTIRVFSSNFSNTISAVYLFDIFGNMKGRLEGISGETIVLGTANLTSGLYFVRVYLGKDMITRKVIIN